METKKKERKRTVISVKMSMYSPIIHRNTMWMKDRLLRQKQKFGSINSITVPQTLLSLSVSSFCSNFPNLSEILFISIYQQDCFCCSFLFMKVFLTFRRKEKKKKRKSRKRESVLILSTVYSILMPHILLNCTKREITISNIITDRRVKNVWIQQNINLK